MNRSTDPYREARALALFGICLGVISIACSVTTLAFWAPRMGWL